VAAKYITKLATEKMKEKYPKYDWSDIIDASLTGANGLRMLGSYKPYPINKSPPKVWRVVLKPNVWAKLRNFQFFSLYIGPGWIGEQNQKTQKLNFCVF
jgi:hypothetical protein